jgi:hypothetical protein
VVLYCTERDWIQERKQTPINLTLTQKELIEMKTLPTLTLILAAGFMAASANAATLSSKAAVTESTLAQRTTTVAMAKAFDPAPINSKTAVSTGTSEQVKVSRTQNCSKPMDMASNTCEMHCR